MTSVKIGLEAQIALPQHNVDRIQYTNVNSEELDSVLEGDMLIPGFKSKSQLRGAAILTHNKWPNGVIPYDISAITDSKDRDSIIRAMEKLMYDTGTPSPTPQDPTWRLYDCVYFRPRTSADRTFVTIEYGTGCWANIGYYQNYRLKMLLQKGGCFDSGTIQHELIHVLGFHHEHNRADRDDHIIINLDNVNEAEKYNFEKRRQEDLTDLYTKYDYDSIMHYSQTAFSKNGRPTMVPKKSGVQIGHSKNLSPIDIEEIRRFYGCRV
ncbi:unnamed protein product [Rotaria sordida]|uniref:Metalloendopeptidase n=1 Tax=Rotaria sordida TaxID=392033 RepID=A0A815JKW3_9BILA|nr:unnamed protein product [Rotaria sordida]